MLREEAGQQSQHHTDETNSSTNSSDTAATEENNSSDNDEKPKVLYLLYNQGLSERIERSCANLDMKIVFTSMRTLLAASSQGGRRTTLQKQEWLSSLLHLFCLCKQDIQRGQGWVKENSLTVNVPYVAGVSKRIRRVCKDFNIRMVSKSTAPSPWKSKQTSSTKNCAPAKCTLVRLGVS